MKNDATTTILNFVLATTVIAGLICGYLSISRTRDQRALAPMAMQVNQKMMMVQSLVTDVNNYNQQAKSQDVARMIAGLMAKPATK